MAQFTIIMTDAGASLLAKGLSGETVEFLKMVMGDGMQSGSASSLNDVVSAKKELPIIKMSRDGDTVTLKSVLTFQSVDEAFFWREIGIFAKDPDTGEPVLYAYGNAGDNGDFIPDASSSTLDEKIICVKAVVTGAHSVTASIDPSVALVTDSELSAHKNDRENPHQVTAAQAGAETEAGAQSKVDALLFPVPSETGGTGDALTVQIDGLTLTDGTTLRLKLHTAISEGATLDVNGAGDTAILDKKGSAVRAGALAGSYMTVIFNGSNFILQGEGGGDYIGSEGFYFGDGSDGAKEITVNTALITAPSGGDVSSLTDFSGAYFTTNSGAYGRTIVQWDYESLVSKDRFCLIDAYSSVADTMVQMQYSVDGETWNNFGLPRVLQNGKLNKENYAIYHPNVTARYYRLQHIFGSEAVICIGDAASGELLLDLPQSLTMESYPAPNITVYGGTLSNLTDGTETTYLSCTIAAASTTIVLWDFQTEVLSPIFYLKNLYASASRSIKLSYSSDGTTYTDYSTATCPTVTATNTVFRAPEISARYWALRTVSSTSTTYSIGDAVVLLSDSHSNQDNPDYVVRNYTSLTIGAGAFATVSQRCAGLILYVQGDVTINGKLDMSQKAAVGIYGALPPVPILARDKNDARITKYGNIVTSLYTAIKGGKGGAGGGVGGGAGGVGTPFRAGYGGGGSVGSYGKGGAGGIGSKVGYSHYLFTKNINTYMGGADNGMGATGYLYSSDYSVLFTLSGGKALGGGTASAFGLSNGSSGTSALNVVEVRADAEAAGGMLMIIAGGSITIGETGEICADGGAGGDGSDYGGLTGTDGHEVTGGGGGGGAGGGVIMLLYKGTYENLGSLHSYGGMGGAGGIGANDDIYPTNIGLSGTAGSAGSIHVQQISE